MKETTNATPDAPHRYTVKGTSVVAGISAAARPKPKPPRMCGSRTTCVALTETDPKKK